MSLESRQLLNLSKIYREKVAEDKDWGYDKDGNSLNPKDKKAKKDFDGDGKLESPEDEYKGSKDKAIKKAIRKESFSDWREDLKEVPNYEQIPIDAKDRNKKIKETKVNNKVVINPEMKEEVVDENIIKFLKNPKATIQKAVDKKLTNATKAGKLGPIKVGGSAKYTGSIGSGPLNTEGYQRNPERDTRSAREKRMDDPDRGINSPAFRAFMAAQQKSSNSKKKKKDS